MLDLEHRITQRLPRLFRGRRARISLPLLRSFGRWSRLADIEDFLRGHAHLRDMAFVRAALDHLQVDYHVPPQDLARIPAFPFFFPVLIE